MWKSILEDAKRNGGTLNTIQEITNQVTDVLNQYKELMIKSCHMLSPNQDIQYEHSNIIVLSELLSPLFGFQGQVVTFLVKEDLEESCKKNQKNKEVFITTNIMSEKDINKAIDVDNQDNSQQNLAKKESQKIEKFIPEGHEITHTVERPSACTYCDKTFTQKSTLRRYMIHTGQVLFVCSHCQERFVQITHVKEHGNTKSGATPLQILHRRAI